MLLHVLTIHSFLKKKSPIPLYNLFLLLLIDIWAVFGFELLNKGDINVVVHVFL